MGASQSDLYKGTYGDNARNIPDEAIHGNINDWLLEVHEDTNYKGYNFTAAQKSAMNRINNTIKNNLTEMDF